MADATVSLSIELDDVAHADEKARVLDALGLALEYELDLSSAELPAGLRDALAVVTLSEVELYAVACALVGGAPDRRGSHEAKRTAGGPGERDATRATTLPASMRNERAVHVQLYHRLPTAARAMREGARRRRAHFMRPPTAPSEADPQAAELAAFMDAHLPADARAVELRVFDDTGRGLASARDLGDGDCALRVPRSLVLTAAGLRARWCGAPFEAQLAALADETALALALLAACAMPGSCWREYSNFLPTDWQMPHCSSWSGAELDALAGTAVADEARGAIDALRDAHAALVSTGLATALLCDDATIAFPFERFRWAAAAVATRALLVDFGDGQGKVGALVPVADMLNHHTRAPLASASYDETTDSIVFSALAAVPAGSQLRLFYGPLPGAELLLQCARRRCRRTPPPPRALQPRGPSARSMAPAALRRASSERTTPSPSPRAIRTVCTPPPARAFDRVRPGLRAPRTAGTASSTTTRCPPRRCASTSSRPTPTQTRTRSRKRCCSHAAVTQRHTLSPRTRRAHRGYSARCASACSTVRGWRQASRRASTSRLRPRAPRTRRWSGQRSDSSLVRCAQASRVAARRTTRRCSPAARARGACCRMRSRRLCDGVSRRSARSTRRSSA